MTSTDRRPVILTAIDWYLPAYRAGGPIRSLSNVVAALGDEIDFRIVCGNRDLGSEADLEVATGTWRTVGKAKVQYLPPAAWTEAIWQALIAEVQPDRLYLNSLYSGPFSRLPWKVARRMGVPTTLAPRGMVGAGALAIKPLRKRVWLTLQRWTGGYDGITWHASTEQEAREIRNWFPVANIKVALNLPVPFAPLPPARRDGPIVILSVGRVHPIKNYGLGVQLAKALAQKGHEVTYRIVGPIEDELEAQQLRDLASGINLELVGPMPPDEIRSRFGDAHLVLVPSLNENFGHTVAEALAAARPVIVSDQTVWSTMKTGPTVACLPLDVEQWTASAEHMLGMTAETVAKHSEATYRDCLMDDRHLAAQRNLFTP